MADIFPNSKWIFMVRDGRAVIHSVITRKVTISGYKMDDPRQCLGKWNNVVQNMNQQCNQIGPRKGSRYLSFDIQNWNFSFF